MDDSENQPLLHPTSALYETLSYESIQDIRPNGRPVSSRSTIPETATYGRNVTWSSAYILVISRVIGSGIFATPGSIVKSVGSVGLALLVWLVGTILAACGLAVSMEFGCMLPRSGGDKVYLEYTYLRPQFLASTLVAVQAVLLGFTASNCIIFSKYTLFALNIEPTEYQQKALAAGLMTAITIVHGCFLRTGIWIQNLLGWMKISMIAAMTLTGLWVILFRRADSSMLVSNSIDRTGYDVFLWDNLWKGSNWSWSLLSTSLFKVFYSYAGLNNVNNVLNEVQDPIRTVKTVCPSALLTACCLYLLANVSYFLVVPIEEIKNSGELVGALLFERVLGQHVGRTLFPLAIAISAAGNVMVVTFAWARVNQEIARQGFLPFSSVLSSSRPFSSPLGGLIVHYVPSLLVIALPPPGDVYNFILDVEGYPGQIFALAIAVGLLIVRRRQPNLPRPFKAWLPAVWLRIVVCVALLAAPLIPPPDRKGDVDFFYATYAVVGVGIIYYSSNSEAITTENIRTMASAAVQLPTTHEPRAQSKSLPPTANARHHVQTTLNFLKENEDGSPPAPTYVGKPETYYRPSVTLPVTVHDVSGHELEYTLDKNGFQFYYHESKEKEFLDDEKIKREYYPETEQLLKDATGASKVFIFDHTIRRKPQDERTPAAQLRGPVQRVHIDQSYAASKDRVSYHLPDEAPELLKGRYQIINVWRPIRTILKDPLAVADAHSVPDDDLVPTKLIYPNRVGETYSVRPNPGFKWYFRYAQPPELVTLIKCFDSKTDGRARRVPHSAFVDPATEGEAPRESIEVRALVFHPEDQE
ncbi:putative methionine permease [Aspergillus thermomutatus]|uniref:Amino acid permease/ SLC12A domain-containing protein n=1 Tax=Aspergillus thermomutatus TaxID=41047 RepID=A0A397G648_ASPTH|nr:uncharacterized protein CDV56_101719 [Aspergillus thermomutatus]RHZ46492.1 hypothetical protein CDV56_101719 [Aspergillus thermomutatus]